MCKVVNWVDTHKLINLKFPKHSNQIKPNATKRYQVPKCNELKDLTNTNGQARNLKRHRLELILYLANSNSKM